MSSITMVGARPAPHRPTNGIGALIHYDWARAIFFGFKRDKITTPKPGELRIFHSTAQSGKQPEATVTVPSDYKVLSGGARVNYSGQGNFLTASFPKDVRTWVARAKQQKVDDIATIDIWAIAVFDPLDDWEVRISQSTGPRSALASTATASGCDFVGLCRRQSHRAGTLPLGEQVNQALVWFEPRCPFRPHFLSLSPLF